MGSLPIGISGSRAAAILGMSPWATPFSVWQDIMEARQPGFNAAHGFDYEAFEGNASTRWGLAFEDAIIKLAEEKVQAGIICREQERHADGFDYITCHIDGLYHATNILHEGKTTTLFNYSDNWGEPGTDKVPVETQIQVQHQMLCTGADECIVSVLVFPKRPDDWEGEGWEIKQDTRGISWLDNNGLGIDPIVWAESLAQMGFFHQYTVKANLDLQALMLSKYRVWWTKYILGETPPAVANYSDIRAMITAPSGTIIVDPDTARWFKEYKDIGSEIGSTGNLAKRRDQLKTFILEHTRKLSLTICPYDSKLTYGTCHAECGFSKCEAGVNAPVLDDESADKWIFRDDQGKKLGSYGKNKSGNMVFR